MLWKEINPGWCPDFCTENLHGLCVVPWYHVLRRGRCRKRFREGWASRDSVVGMLHLRCLWAIKMGISGKRWNMCMFKDGSNGLCSRNKFWSWWHINDKGWDHLGKKIAREKESKPFTESWGTPNFRFQVNEKKKKKRILWLKQEFTWQGDRISSYIFTVTLRNTK